MSRHFCIQDGICAHKRQQWPFLMPFIQYKFSSKLQVLRSQNSEIRNCAWNPRQCRGMCGSTFPERSFRLEFFMAMAVNASIWYCMCSSGLIWPNTALVTETFILATGPVVLAPSPCACTVADIAWPLGALTLCEYAGIDARFRRQVYIYDPFRHLARYSLTARTLRIRDR
jgi:hypothetical protein